MKAQDVSYACTRERIDCLTVITRAPEACTIVRPDKMQAPMLSTRGCPFGCRFCYRSKEARSYRMRSPENVADEVEFRLKQGINDVTFVDSVFNISTNRVKALCLEFIGRRLTFNWDFRGRIDSMNEESAELLAKAGCRRIFFGVENANDDILKSIGKNITVSQIRDAFGLAKKYGIETVGYFMFGFPGESVEKMERTAQLARSIKADYAQFNPFVPLPGTELYREALDKGVIEDDYFQAYAMKPAPGIPLRLYTETVSREIITEIVKKAYRSFYFRPSYVFRRLIEVRSLQEMTAKVRAFFSLFRFQLKRK